MIAFLKLVPWKLVGAAAVVGAVLWFYWHQVAEAEDRGYARAVAQYQDKELAAQRRQREVEENARNARAGELAQVRAEYAARPDAVIRLCVNTPAMPAATEAGQRSESRAPGAGTLQAATGSDPGTDFDPAPLYALAQEADEIVAACRAQQTATF